MLSFEKIVSGIEIKNYHILNGIEIKVWMWKMRKKIEHCKRENNEKKDSKQRVWMENVWIRCVGNSGKFWKYPSLVANGRCEEGMCEQCERGNLKKNFKQQIH